MGRYRNVTILAAAIFFQILGLAVQIKRPNEVNSTGAGGRMQQGEQSESSRLIRVWAVTVIAPMEKGIVHLQSGASDIWHNYFYLRGVRQENRDLREQIEKLRLEQVRLKQDAEQAHRLQALLGFKEQFIGSTTAAQVIGSSGSEQSRLVYIDKGRDDGMKPGMPVITSDGIVGKVLNVIDIANSSQVLLINDQQSGVGAILEDSRLQGVLKGKPSGELIIDKIMSEEEVKPGERILTSGGDQIFPKGLPIGTVAKVSKGNEFLQISVKPAARLGHLEEVLVITKKQERSAPVSTATSTRAADILAERLPSVPDKPATPAVVTKLVTNAGNVPTGASTTQGVTRSTTLPAVSGSVPSQPKTQPTGLAATGTVSSQNPAAAATQTGQVVTKPVTTGAQPVTTGAQPAQSAAKPAGTQLIPSSAKTATPTQTPPAQKPAVTKPSNPPADQKPNPPGDTPQ